MIGLAPRTTLNDRYRAFRQGVSDPGADGPDRGAVKSAASESRPGMLRGLVAAVGSWSSWPDESRGWLLRARGRILAECDREGADIILSSGPPHGAHLAVLLSGRWRRTPWVVDLRDPWASASDEGMQGPNSIPEWVRWSYSILEGFIFRRAAAVLVTTPELKAELSDRYPGVAIAWVPNGVDMDSVQVESGPPLPHLTALHLGTVYLGRDPQPMIRAFEEFLSRVPQARDSGSSLRFVGSIEGVHRRTLTDAIARNPPDTIRAQDPIPRKDALTLLSRASLSVILAQDQKTMVPAKIYEAVALGIPALVITEPGSASDRAAERYGMLRADPERPEEIVGVLEKLWEGANNNGADRPPGAPPVSHRELAAGLDRILRVVLTGGGAQLSDISAWDGH